MPRFLIGTTAVVVWIVLAAVIVIAGITFRFHRHEPLDPRLLAGAATPDPTDDASRWVFSQLFSTSSPLRTPISTLKSQGAETVDHQYMDSLWRQGFPSRNVYTEIPMYLSEPADRLVTVDCHPPTARYGTCPADGLKIHENENDYIQSIFSVQNEEDHHLVLIDQNSSRGGVELDCWQAGPRTSNSRLSGAVLGCAWAGLYKLGTNGLHGTYGDQSPGTEGFHFGPAAGLFIVTGTELLKGHIDHALALNVSCLNDPSIYPADTQSGTDSKCDDSINPPHYGNVIHLLWPEDQIAKSAYSTPCKTILTALATYGAYLSDTGNYGVIINLMAERAYTSVGARDPYPAIVEQLEAGGDSAAGKWTSCFNRLQSSDFEMLQLAPPHGR